MLPSSIIHGLIHRLAWMLWCSLLSCLQYPTLIMMAVLRHSYYLSELLIAFQGQCQGSTVGGEVKSWIEDNKTLVIGLAAGIGALLLLALLSCVIRCCRRPTKQQRRRNRPQPRHTGGWQGQQPIGDVPMPPAQMAQQGGFYNGASTNRTGGWIDSPNAGGWKPPYHPPPTYGSPTVRYA